MEDLEERVNEDVFKMYQIVECIIERYRKRHKDCEIKSKKSFKLIKWVSWKPGMGWDIENMEWKI